MTQADLSETEVAAPAIMSDSDVIAKCRRSDALRNEEKLVDAAREAFLASGTEASLEDIARKAGVGIGTLYRHFPTRRHLVEAVARKGLGEVVELGNSLLGSNDPGQSLMTWTKAVVKNTAEFRGLAMTMAETFCKPTADESPCSALRVVGEAMLAECQAAGVVRNDVTVDDFTMMVNALAWTADQTSAASFDTLLAVMFDGLTARN